MKRRLVGAVVLVSLAVIFIPMLLDGGKEDEGMPLFGSNIPDQPEMEFEPLEIPLEPIEAIPEEMPQLLDKPEPQPEPVAEPNAAESTAETELQRPATPKPEPKPEPEPKPVEKPAAQTQSPEAAQSEEAVKVGWVVQVGSFSQSENAIALRDKLRAKGFTAFVEKLKTEAGTVYRVRLGPEIKREEAERQLEKLKRVMEMDGIVMGHGS